MKEPELLGCAIFNVAPSYREAVFRLIDEEFNVEFFFGDRIGIAIKLMNYETLDGFRSRLKYTPILRNWHLQQGAVKLAFRNYQYYIIGGDMRCLSNWVVLIINRIKGKRSFVWTHGYYGDESLLEKFIKRLFFGLSSKVLLYGDYARNLMLIDGYKKEKLVCIYNSLDYSKQLEVREKLLVSNVFVEHFGNSNPVLVYIGRIQKGKKLELIIEAIKLLRFHNVIYNLIIIGEDVESNGLQELVKDSNLEDQLWFFGPCYDESQIGDLIYNSNVCVSPGNVGLTALHSLVYGTPVVTHNNFINQGPEFESIQDCVTGMFFVENSIQDLAEKTKRMVELTIIDREKVRKDCYKIVRERYNPTYQVEVLRSIIE